VDVPNIPLVMEIATADVQLSFPCWPSSAGRAEPLDPAGPLSTWGGSRGSRC